MIASIRGEIIHIDEDSFIIDVQGVGYQVFVPVAPMTGQFRQGTEIFLYTHLIVREDAWQLFGFLTQDEVALFRHFLAVGGIGGKTALSILNQMTVEQIAASIMAGDAHPFEQVSGIGKKTAQRIVLELKDKLAKSTLGLAAQFGEVPTGAKKAADNDAVLALVQLGYSASEAKKAVVKVVSDDVGATTETVIRQALRLLSKF